MKVNVSKSGFTLIELMVVVSIIAMLASVVLASLTGARRKGFDAKFVSEALAMRTAIALYRSNNTDVPRCPYYGCTPDEVTDENSPTGLETMLGPIVAEGDISKIIHYTGWNGGVIPGGYYVYTTYLPGLRTSDDSFSYMTETMCGATNSDEWQPGTAGVFLFNHDAGHELGLTHTYTTCQAVSSLGGWVKTCDAPVTSSSQSCMTLY